MDDLQFLLVNIDNIALMTVILKFAVVLYSVLLTDTFYKNRRFKVQNKFKIRCKAVQTSNTVIDTLFIKEAFDQNYQHIQSSKNIQTIYCTIFLAFFIIIPNNKLSSTSHIDTSTTFCPLITQTFRIISVRCIALSLRSKTRRRAALLLPSYICSCQSVGTSTSHFPLRPTWQFQFPYYRLSVPE